MSALTLAQGTVGRTSGEASVSTAGAGRYVVPLALPPGTGGLTPSLAIRYDSRGGNGLLGVGFGLDGFSTIHRCVATIAQDGAAAPVALLASDRLCLDGQRLRLTGGVYGQAGSTYQTEVETFARVTAFGAAGRGPESFRVEGRDGLIYEYGAGADARIEAAGTDTVREWALSRVRDRDGNAIEFRYAEDATQGSYRPLRIDYTGNAALGVAPYYTVSFQYEARPAADTPSGYFAGGRVRDPQRLQSLELRHASGALLRRFALGYANAGATGRSTLATLQECAATTCLPATAFAWHGSTPGWSEAVALPAASGLAASAMAGDVDGDGFDDLLYYDSRSASFAYRRGSADGLLAETRSTGVSATLLHARALSMDLDGDGRRDVLVPDAAGTWQWLSHAGGQYFSLRPTGVVDDAGAGYAAALDVDGDGRDDLVYARPAQAAIFWRRSTTTGVTPTFAAEARLGALPPGTSFAPEPFGNHGTRFRSTSRTADFNGDGRADLVVAVDADACAGRSGCTPTPVRQWLVLASAGAELRAAAQLDSGVAPLLGDFNGDALTDLAWAPRTSSRWELRYGAGARENSAAQLSGSVPTTAGATGASAVVAVADWDGDGRSDLLLLGAGQYCRSNGESLEACQALGLAPPGAAASVRVGDFNGDGLADLGLAGDALVQHLHRPGRPDLLARVTDGLGHWTTFDYAVTTDPAVHAASATPAATFGVRELRSPFHVVRKLSRSDGAAGRYELAYAYAGARVHTQGRGFLGFARRSATDSRSGQVATEEYSQEAHNFERIGRPVLYSLRRANGALLQRTSLAWSRHLLGVAPEQRRYPFVSLESSEDFEVTAPYDGSLFRRTETRHGFDTFGSLVERQVTVTQAATALDHGAQFVDRFVHGGVVNDTTTWCLGLPASVQHTASTSLPTGAPQTRTTAYAWDPQKCRLTQQVVEPSSSQWRVTTDFAYDGFGNPGSVTVTPVGEAARVTTTSWSADGRFVTQVADAESLRTASQWDAVSGRMLATVDAAGGTTRWTYDAIGRIATVTQPDGTVAAFELESCGPDCLRPEAILLSRVVRRGTDGTVLDRSERGLDAAGREIFAKRAMPGGAEALVVSRYDARGQLSERSLPQWCCGAPERWSRYTYDELGRVVAQERPTSESDPTPHVTRWQLAGFRSSEVDPQGRVSTRYVDGAGRVVQVVDRSGAQLNFAYDAFGNLLWSGDAYGFGTLHSYNLRGLRVATADPDFGATTFEYTPLGELKSRRDAKGQVVTYSYDRLSRLRKRVEPEGTTVWTYGDAAAAGGSGRLLSVSGPGFEERYDHDALGRRIAATAVFGGRSYVTRYGYDPVSGLLDRITYPESGTTAPLTVRYVHDRGRLRSVADAAEPTRVYWQAESYSANGVPLEERLGNGIRVVSGYDAVTGLLDYRLAGRESGDELQELSYRWDAAGNLIERRDLKRDLREEFSYDFLDRLEGVALNGVPTWDIAYDAAGNITRKSDVGDYAYDAARRNAVVAAGTNRYAYDASGNVVSANGTTLTWTSFNLPRTIRHPNGNSAEFHYRPDGLRHRQVTRAGTSATDTAYAAGGLYERVSRDGSVEHRHYIVANGRRVAVHQVGADGSPTLEYLLQDHLGSTAAITSASGELLADLSYQAFGQRRAGDWKSATISQDEWRQVQATTSRGYAGHEHLDNLGLIHMDGRVYDAVLGRFLSPDPFVQDPVDLRSYNRYSYVFNNPLALRDPSGFMSVDSRSLCLDYCVGESAFFNGYSGMLEVLAYRGALFDPLFAPRCTIYPYCTEGFRPRPRDVVQTAPEPSAPPQSSPSTPDGAHEAAAASMLNHPLLRALVPGLAASGYGAASIAAGDYLGALAWYTVAIGEVGLAALTAGVSPASQPARGAVGTFLPERASSLGAATGESVAAAVARYGPHEAGPLPSHLAGTFRGGTYSDRVLEADTTVYRVYGGTAGRIGQFWSRLPPAGPVQSRIDLGLAPEWGNSASHVVRARLPAGTRVFEGTAAPQGNLLGGGHQMVVPNFNAGWIDP